MGWKVARVCGAATEIPQDGARDARDSGSGWVCMTVEDAVVLAGRGDVLRVADAQAFCAGSIETRCAVELPPNVTLAGRDITGARYGVAWGKKQQVDAAASSDICLVDFQAGEVAVKSLPALTEEIVDAYVDARGKQIVAVGGATGKLWGWNPSDCDFNDAEETWEQCEWTEVKGTAVGSSSADVRSCGRFVSSSVMGNCFVYLRATQFLNGSVVLEKWILDVDACWSPSSFSSRVIGNSSLGSFQGLKLFTTKVWTSAAITAGSMLYHVQLDQDLKNSSVQQILLDHQIIDGAWVDNDTAFALLLANGQISIGTACDSRSMELLSIATTSTMSKRLSLSALLGKAVTAALQLVWIDQEKQVVVDFGTRCISFKLEINDEECVANPTNNTTKLSPCHAFTTNRRRRVITRLDSGISDLGESMQGLLKSCSSLTSYDLLDTARIVLSQSWKKFEDEYFMLLSAIHQQLAGASVNTGGSQDPIDCVGKSLKLFEVLISLTISMEANILRQVSAKLLSTVSGCPSGSDRKRHYCKEISTISQQVRVLLSGVSESEDWWSHSMEATIFLRVYFTTMIQLVQDIFLEALPIQQKSVKGSNIYAFCQLIVERDGSRGASEPILTIERNSDSLFDRVKQLLESYTMMCCCLQVNGVAIDLGHLFSINLSPVMLKRKEMLCCCMKPWQRVASNPDTAVGQNSNWFSDTVMEVTKYATNATILQLLIHFCLESRSLLVHPCLQVLCKQPVNMAEGESPERLHSMACEMYIGEIMAIFQHIGAIRQFKHSQRTAGCNVDSMNLPRAIESEFDDYHHMLSAEMTRSRENCRVNFRKSTLWEFSHLDTQLCARVVCLISRVVWHLEAIDGGLDNLIRDSFGMTLFDSRLGELPTDLETVRDCITTAREVIMPTEAKLRLPTFKQPEHVKAALAFKSQKIARTIVLVTWALWLREKAAYCTRSYHTLRYDNNLAAEKEAIGALAATSALHLNAVGTLCGYYEELLSIQITLLEEATTVNPCKSAAIIAWGFPKHKILTRHLKRYRVLREVLRLATLKVSLAESELHYKHLHKRIQQAFFRVQGTKEGLTGPDNSEVGVLVSGCCDPDFLQIVAVLTRSPYEVVNTSHAIPNLSADISEPVQKYSQAPNENIEAALPTNIGAETEPGSVPQPAQIPKPLMSESLISRDEVIALLQAQTRHLEEKIHAVASVNTNEENRSSGPFSSLDDRQEPKADATLQSLRRAQTKAASETLLETTREDITGVTDVQRMARISLQVRNLNRRQYPSTCREADMQSNQHAKSAQRHDSIRNALKLFRLRQENGGCVRSDQENSNRLGENGIPNIRDGADTKNDRDKQDPTNLSLPGDKTKRTGVKRKSARSQRSDEDQYCVSKEPVYPLRLEYGTDSASLKLLGRNSHQRNPSLKKRQFVLDRERTKSYPYQVKSKPVISSIDPTEVVQLKSSGAQTNNIVQVVEPPAKLERETKKWTSQQSENGPEKASPMAQEFSEDKQVTSGQKTVNTSSSVKGVGIQCRVTEDFQTQVNRMRRLRGPPPLNIADKFPIWVDLDGADNGGEKKHFKERKHFLRVARFGNLDTTGNSTSNDSADNLPFLSISPSVSTILVPRKLSSEAGSEENQSDGRQSPTHSSVQAEEDRAAQQTDEAMNARYRASYRQHYSYHDRSRSLNDEHDSASGIDTLIDLRDNMQRMTQRLRVLETCANSIDEEFKVSQKRLSRMGDHRPDGASAQTRPLDNIDEVLEMTQESHSQAGGRRHKGGLLSKKASSDLTAAKKILETIEQLTISSNDEC